MQNIFPPVPFSEPNEHGVFADHTRHTIYEHKNTRAEVLLARSEAGYHWSTKCEYPQGGNSSYPWLKKIYPTQHEAETLALEEIKRFFGHEKDYAKKALAAIDKLLNTHRNTALSEVLAEIAALEAQLKKAA
jgi:hypothetical protein